MIIEANSIEKNTLINIIHPEGKDILEIGCGDGAIASYLAISANRYIASDYDKDIIAIAKEKHKQPNLEFICASGDKIDINDSSMDVIFMHLALHEIPVQIQGATLIESHRILKNNGVLVIADPTEPAGDIQGICNIIYNDYNYFDHSDTVIHSNKVISKVIEHGLFSLQNQFDYKIDFTFDSVSELIDLIMNWFSDIKWTPDRIIDYRQKVCKLLKINDDATNFTIYDVLTATVLIKI